MRKYLLSPEEECRSRWCVYKGRQNGFCGHHVREAGEERLVKAFITELEVFLKAHPEVEIYAGDDATGDPYYPNPVVVIGARGGSWEEQLEM